MTIKPIDISQLPVLSEGLSLFASREWAQVYQGHLQAYGIFNSAGEQQGSFSLFQKKRLGLSYIITPPFAPHIGLHYSQYSDKTVSRQTRSKEVHALIADFIKQRSPQILELALSTAEQDSQPYAWQGFEVKPRHTYHLDLSASSDELLQAMSPERRKNIRKAEADGLQVTAVQDSQRFMHMIAKTLKRQALTIDLNIFERLLQSEDLSANRAMYICSKDGQDLAASLVVWDAHQAYYLIGGYDELQGHQGAGTLNLWQAILDSRARGQKIFDFEGSSVASIERYFRGFGAELRTFFVIQKDSAFGRVARRIKGQ